LREVPSRTDVKRFYRMAGLAAVACAFLFLPSVLRAQGAAGEYPDLSPAEAREVLGKRSGDPRFVLLDVRTPKEFDAERIEGAVLVDYLSPEFRDEMSKLDREKTYLVYCRTGSRSKGALKAMRELGFRNVLHLASGIAKWKEAGFPTAR
jgi:rhodanese-related sulfurtransferase